MKPLITTSLILGLFFSFVSCESNDSANAPIPPKAMQAILLDIHTAEYYSQGLGKHKGTYMKEYDSLARFYTSIFKHHNIDIEKFELAMDWYKKHPAVLDSIYINIKDEMTNMQDDGKKKGKSDVIIPSSSMKDGTKKPENDSTANKKSNTPNRQSISPSEGGIN